MDSVEHEITNRIAVFNEHNNTCDEFKVWVQKEIKYEKWFHLFRYPYMHPIIRDKDFRSFMLNLSENYFDFVDWDRENYRESLVSKYYMGALDEFFKINNHINAVAIENKDIFKKTTLAADTMKNLLLENTKPFERDLLMTKFYCQYLNHKDYESIKDIFNPSLIKDDWLRQQLVKKFESEKHLYENPEFKFGSNLNHIATENDFLQELIKKYPNKVIYLDFWATWCGPCMEEFPHAASIKRRLEGRDIVFVYLANQCKKAAWESTIAEKNIIGEHYLLTDKQYALLSDIFSIKGIPHFAIIDKQGEIINYNAPRPSSGDILIELIEDI